MKYAKLERWVRSLPLWTLALLTTRLLVLLTEGAEIYQHDELYAGALALEMNAGRGLPLALTAHTPYCGGPIVIAWFAARVFELLGPSTAALRLLSILLTTATATLTLYLLRRTAGTRAMAYGGLLLLFPPSHYGRLAVMAWGNHAESALPGTVALALALLAVAATAAVGGRGLRRAATIAFAAGVAAAAALFFSYSALVYLATVGIVLAAAAGRRVTVPAFAVGAALGTLPTALLNLAWHTPGVAALGHMVGAGPARLPRRALSVVGFELRHYLAPALELPTVLAAGAWAISIVALGGLLVSAVRRGRDGSPIVGEALLGLPVAGFLAAACLSDFPIGPRHLGFFGYRYFATITPALLACVGLSLSRLRPRYGLPLLLALIVPNAIVTASRLPAASDYAFRQHGVSYYAYGIHAYETLRYQLPPTLELIDQLDGDEHRAALTGVAWAHTLNDLTSRQRWADPTSALIGYLRDLPDATGTHRDAFLDRLAHVIAPPGLLTLDRDGFDRAIASLESMGAPTAAIEQTVAALVAGLAAGGASPDELDAATANLPRGLQPAGWRGLGRVAARTGDSHLPAEPAHRAAFAAGFGFETARAALLDGAPRPAPTWPDDDGTDLASAHSRGVARALAAYEPENRARAERLAAQLRALAPPPSAG